VNFHTHRLYIIWEMNNRPVGGRSSETQSHPVDMINMNNTDCGIVGCDTWLSPTSYHLLDHTRQLTTADILKYLKTDKAIFSGLHVVSKHAFLAAVHTQLTLLLIYRRHDYAVLTRHISDVIMKSQKSSILEVQNCLLGCTTV
jgi:hypothetical protein